MQKQVKFKKYNIRIAKLLDLILNMNEKQQETILQHAEELVRGDRRFSDRKPCDLHVDFATADRAHKGRIKNISTKGVFIESRVPIRIGEAVLMAFKVNRESKVVKLKGEIAHATRWGIGIEFTATGPRFEAQIRDHIQRIR
jgi:hypothetical protein